MLLRAQLLFYKTCFQYNTILDTDILIDLIFVNNIFNNYVQVTYNSYTDKMPIHLLTLLK